jgi:hypothetical protein
MANTPQQFVRVDPELEMAARAAIYLAAPELADVDSATLLRVGLLVLAGHQVQDAVPLAKRKRGPKQQRAAA